MMDFLKDSSSSLASIHSTADNHLLFGSQSAAQSTSMCTINNSLDNGSSHRSPPTQPHISTTGGGGNSGGGGGASASINSNHVTATPVISLFKLKNFLHQPRFKNLISNDGKKEAREKRKLIFPEKLFSPKTDCRIICYN